MMDLFSSIPVLIDGVSGGYILNQVQMRGRDLFTGLFHVSGSQEFTVFFSEGRLVSLYRLNGGCWEHIPAAAWDETLSHAAGDLRELRLPDEGLRVWRLLLETDFGGARTVPSLRASELNSYLSKWQRGGKAGLALVRQAELGAVVLLPSDSPEPTEGVLVSRSQLKTGLAVVTQMQTWGDQICQVKLCTQNERSEGWREYNLRVSFGLLIQKVLKRYEELAGRFLVSDLDEQVNAESHSRGWAISLFGNNMSIRQYFETTKAAGRVYAALLNIMNRHIDSVVGRKMAETIFSNTMLQLNEEARSLLQMHVLGNTSSQGDSLTADMIQ